MRAAADKLRADLGPIDVLIANAGIGPTRDAAKFSAEEVAEVMNVNVIGASNSVAAVMPEMVARGRGTVGGDFESGGLSRFAEVRGLLRQQGGGFGIFRESAAGSGATRNRCDDNSSGFYQDSVNCRARMRRCRF